MNRSRVATASWLVLAYTILVILWGAFVRATGSGAGCGNHWPLCNGEVIPRPEQIETIIEFTHRAMTGLLIPFAILVVIWIFRRLAPGHLARRAAVWSLVFLLVESLIGAGLVRFELVADNASVARAFAISIHLVNTFLLLASQTLTAWWASGFPGPSPHKTGGLRTSMYIGLVGLIILGTSGAITALGDTLFPAESLAAGFAQDFSPTANFLIRLRIFHPLISILVGLYIGGLAAVTGPLGERSPRGILARTLLILILLQLGIGLINIILLAPVWMQIIHLLAADLIWIAYVLFMAATLADQSLPVEVTEPLAANLPTS